MDYEIFISYGENEKVVAMHILTTGNLPIARIDEIIATEILEHGVDKKTARILVAPIGLKRMLKLQDTEKQEQFFG